MANKRDKKEREERVCLTTLRSRGWTDKLINDLLPEPVLVKNPVYRSRSPMKTWSLKTVCKAEEDERFQKRLSDLYRQNKIKEQKKQEQIAKVSSTISVSNPALDYSLARSIHRHFIINVGGTNTGKTYSALEALKKAESGVYLAPLRLLAMEIQDKMLDCGIPCNMITGEEENLVEGAKHTSSTVEKINLYTVYDVGVIDECQMIVEKERGGSWTRAILGLAAHTIYLCMSCDALDICKKLIDLCGDTYEVVEFERKVPLRYVGSIDEADIRQGDALILFSRKSVLQTAKDLKSMGITSSVIYGALPYKARKHQVELYNKGETKCIVSTDAIGMGLNLPIKRIIFLASEKFNGITQVPLSVSEVKQISGRAGRYGMFEEGLVGYLATDEIDGEVINKGLICELSPIKKALLPFPEEILSENSKVTNALSIWSEIQYPEIFDIADTTVLFGFAKYLEINYPEKTYPIMDKKTVLKLSSIAFDENNEYLKELWKKYCDFYVHGENIPLPYHFEEDLSLEEYELLYKKIDLYYSFCKVIGQNVDEIELSYCRENLIYCINRQLLKEGKSKSKPNRCKRCGKVLPRFSRFTICNECHDRPYSYW